MTEALGCGTCNLCCKVKSVIELSKPACQWCSHVVKGKGCGIYETRPESCAEYKCLWLASQELPDGMKMPLEMRPNQSKVILEQSNNERSDLILHVDPGYTGKWRSDARLMKLVNHFLKEGNEVIVVTGDRRTLLSPK